MEGITFETCGQVPAPFWLFCLDEMAGNTRRAQVFKHTEEAKNKWKIQKDFYKQLQGYIKADFKDKGEYLHRYADKRYENQPNPVPVNNKPQQLLLPPSYFRGGPLLPPSYFTVTKEIPGGHEDRILSPVSLSQETTWNSLGKRKIRY